MLSKDDREETAECLNSLLANEAILAARARQFHWNVVGPFFGPLHDLFGEQYDTLSGFIDDIAERVRALDEYPLSTLTDFVEGSELKEEEVFESKKMLASMVAGHDSIVKCLREAIAESKDEVTSNFLQDLCMKHEKMVWMLRSHLE